MRTQCAKGIDRSDIWRSDLWAFGKKDEQAHAARRPSIHDASSVTVGRPLAEFGFTPCSFQSFMEE
jgi:hypothetical protein